MAGTLRPFWLAGSPASSEQELEVRHPYDGRVVDRVAVPSAEAVEEAVAAAVEATTLTSELSAHARAEALQRVSAGLGDRRDEMAAVITAESGKPIQWSRVEVGRAIATFRWAAEEARRFAGELHRLDTDAPSARGLAIVRRFSRGPVLAIGPFNFPLNLLAHKIAPAIAVGAPVIVKPAPATPLSALMLGEILRECELPRGSWSVLPISNEATATLVQDPRLPVVSFTGSGAVGRAIREAVPHKHVTLELGGNAAVVVCSDWSSDHDLQHAARRIAAYAHYQAGQSCISVQRVICDESLHDALLGLVIEESSSLKTGDPFDTATHVGPLINEQAAIRVQEWIEEATSVGGRLMTGGTRSGATIEPTVLTNVPSHARVVAEEVFGPVLVTESVANVSEAFARANDSRYGLQTGVFTHDLDIAFRAHRELQVGGVVIGDVPSVRADHVPYGGTKDSGVGREGVKAAMDDYTLERTLLLTAARL